MITLDANTTTWLTIPVKKPTTTVTKQGVSLGQGPCSAVRLSVNAYAHDTSPAALVVATNFFIYYGDVTRQEKELIIVDNAGHVNTFDSGLILCRDLSEVFVRVPLIAAYPDIIMVQARVYGLQR